MVNRDPREPAVDEPVYQDVAPPGTGWRATWPTRVFGGEREELKNRVQWGPILAGIAVAIAALLILSVLGLAVGSTAFSPRSANQHVTTGAAIWGIISALIAFFLGGWVAAKSAAVGGAGSGLLNGLVVGCAILVLVLWLTGTGIGALLGTVSEWREPAASRAECPASDQGRHAAGSIQYGQGRRLGHLPRPRATAHRRRARWIGGTQPVQ